MKQGTVIDPMTLAEALQSPRIKPGHTLYLRGGVYSGDVTSDLAGVTIRPHEDERPIIDGAVTINGAYTTWQGIEFRYSGWPTRVSAEPGNDPQDIPIKWLHIYGPGSRLIDCTMHDLAGVGWWRDATDSEISGCHMYNNGWIGPDRGHGPAIYAQNANAGDKLVKDCVICPSYSFTGFQFFGTQTAPLDRFHIENNILIGTRFILGGGMPVNDAHVIGNLLWQSVMQIGYNSPLNGSAEIRDNYIGLASIAPHTLTELQMTGNTMINRDGIELMSLTMPNVPHNYAIDGNAYQSNRTAVLWNDAILQDFAQWQASGYDAGGTFDALPVDAKVFVGNGNVTVFNWGNAQSVPAPVAGTYTNAQNPAESIVLAQGAPLPMTGWTVATPIAGAGPLTSFDPRFAVFLVTT